MGYLLTNYTPKQTLHFLLMPKTPGRFSIYLGFCTVRPEGFEPPTF